MAERNFWIEKLVSYDSLLFFLHEDWRGQRGFRGLGEAPGPASGSDRVLHFGWISNPVHNLIERPVPPYRLILVLSLGLNRPSSHTATLKAESKILK